MKLKTQENIRKLEYLLILINYLMIFYLEHNSDQYAVQEFIKILNENKIDLNNIRDLGVSVLSLDIIANCRVQRLTDEYKQLKELYKQIISNIGDLYHKLELEHPVDIFSSYIYMYRSGYFSVQKKFIYSNDMKDFSKLSGIDIIRGSGVCRSISTMLTDIYNELGMNGYNLIVKTDEETIANMETLSNVNLLTGVNSEKYVKLISIFTKYISIGNHMITMVENNGINYIFDPTNDGFLYNGEKNHLLVNEKSEYYMKISHLSKLITWFYGQVEVEMNIKKINKQLNLPTISKEEYRTRYLETLNFCKENLDLLEKFYKENIELYHKINDISEKENGVIKRLIPIIPNFDKRK